jgi:gamma-glutamyl:cysteine ligase YbdK (ATP-grasp superfamily)
VFRFAIEHETALLRTDGSFADFSNTTFDELQSVVERLPEYAADYPPLHVDELGIKRKRWYVEGFERFSGLGRYLGSDAKGIETRTIVHPTIASAVHSLREDFAALAGESRASGFLPVPISFNPFRSAFRPRPPLNCWEREHRHASPERRTATLHMATYGPDLNLSVAGMNDDEMIDIARRLTFLSPYIVPFSFSSPFADGDLWGGLSRRTHGRTGRRPAVLVFLRDLRRLLPSDPSLTVAARLPAEAGRIEFKAFDTCADLDLYGSLLALLKGLVLDRRTAGRRTTPDARLHQRSSLAGFDDPEIRAGAAVALDAAETALAEDPDRDRLGPLWAMLHARVTPAHTIIEAYRQGGPIGEVLRDVGEAAGYGSVDAPGTGMDHECLLGPWRPGSARRSLGGPVAAGWLSSGALRGASDARLPSQG